MTPPSTTRVYEGYLTDDVARELGIETPVETEHVDSFDAVRWVTSDAGWEFYPYVRVLTIQERPGQREAGVTGTAGESETEASLGSN